MQPAESFRYDQAMVTIDVQPLTNENFHSYGWVLGKSDIPGFRSAETDFWEEHVFDPGAGGETQILWVNYRNQQRAVTSLEVHRLTQQVLIPLTGEITQVVAESSADGSPNLATIRAFRVETRQGICMRPGCWHTTRVEVPEVQCMMLTRRSTTVDLLAHLTGQRALLESAIAAVVGRLT